MMYVARGNLVMAVIGNFVDEPNFSLLSPYFLCVCNDEIKL